MTAPIAPRDTGSRQRAALPTSINEEQVKRVISVTGNLPPVPHVAARLIELVGREETSVADVQKAISSDQALTARILKMANSVFYSFDRKITTLSHAIVILGFRAVQSMAVAASSRSLFVKKGAQFGLKEKLFWEHSMGVAIGCRQIARTVGHENEEAAFVTGLLHDIGKAVLNQSVPRKYGEIVEQVYNRGRSFAEVEQEVLGFDHSHIGALIAQKWNFDWEMVETIAYHHRPEVQSSGSVPAAMLALSNVLCKEMGVGLERVPEGSSANHWSAGTLGLDETACREIQEIIRTVLEEEKSLYAV